AVTHHGQDGGGRRRHGEGSQPVWHLASAGRRGHGNGVQRSGRGAGHSQPVRGGWRPDSGLQWGGQSVPDHWRQRRADHGTTGGADPVIGKAYWRLKIGPVIEVAGGGGDFGNDSRVRI